jgi:hypothetical protein
MGDILLQGAIHTLVVTERYMYERRYKSIQGGYKVDIRWIQGWI